jgi:hypothetical protein
MSSQDAELDQFRNGVSCAALLERLQPVWRLDRKPYCPDHCKIAYRKVRDRRDTA